MRDYMLDAQKAYEIRNFENALQLYYQEISTHPEKIFARERAARCLWILKRPLDAIAMCEEILNLDSNYVMAYVIEAEAYYDMKEYSKAAEKIRLAYSIDPTHVEVLVSYGSLLLLEKETHEALNILEKAIQKDPNSYTAYNNLAVIYVARRNREKVLYCAKEMYRLRRTILNRIRLLVAYADYYRLTNVSFVFLVILTLTAELLRMWAVFWGTLAFILALIVLKRYLSR